jgi:hypothetical protein
MESHKQLLAHEVVLCRKFPEQSSLLSYLLSPLEICCETKEMKESLTKKIEDIICRKW